MICLYQNDFMKNAPFEIILPGRGITRQISCPVFQSPLSGVTDQVFRSLVRKWAPDALLFTEMVSATCLELGRGLYKVDELGVEHGPVGVQLFDHRPEVIADAAIRAEAAGAFLVDINMGCPVKKVAKKGGGSALLKDPDLAARIVSKVVDSVKVPVTVKTRLGWDEETADPVGFAKRLETAGAQLLTLHGRTREQGFSGKSDWNSIAVVKKALNIPVIANGDIKNAKDAIDCLSKTGADGVMIGRGSMGAPWLIGQIDAVLRGNPIVKTPEPKERIKIAQEQLIQLVRINGDHGLMIARKHLNWICKDIPRADELRYELMRSETPKEALAILEDKLNCLN